MWICACDLDNPTAHSLSSDPSIQKLTQPEPAFSNPQSKPSVTASTKTIHQTPMAASIVVPRSQKGRAGRPSTKIRPVKKRLALSALFPFYIGLGVSGLLLRLCTASQQQFFQMVGDHIFSLFRQPLLPLFGTLFLSGFFLLTTCLLLGFGLLGHTMTNLVLFSYGIGTGLVCLHALLSQGIRGWLFYACIPGFFAAILACNLGHLNACIRPFSAYLMQLAAAKENPPVQHLSGRVLVDRYLACCCIQILCCTLTAAAAKSGLQFFS